MRILVCYATAAVLFPVIALAQSIVPNGPMGPVSLPTSLSTPTTVTAPSKTGTTSKFAPTERTLSRGMRGADVLALQQLFVKLKLLPVDSATGFFGATTESTVKKFQCAYLSVCKGTPASNGYGAVGPKTRAKIATMSSSQTYAQSVYGGGYSQSSYGSSYSQGTYVTTPPPPPPSSAPPPPPSPTPPPSPPSYGNISARLNALQVKRTHDWTRYGSSFWPYWEVVYDGTDSPSDNVPSPFQWDNPIDDDWWDPATLGYGSYLDQFRLNTPSRGFLTVDRTYKNLNKNGNIYRRDEFLDSNTMHTQYGFTMEVKFKLLPQSQKDAFYINYVANDCTASVALSGATNESPVGLISTGSIFGGNTNHIAFDTTTDFVTLRLVRAPGASTYSVYLVAYANEGDAKPAQYSKLVDGTCLTDWHVGSGRHVKYPYVQIGDNSGATDSNAAYILDFVRYRRDAYTPDETLSSIQDRWPLISLPNNAPSGGDAYLYGNGYFGSVSGGYLSNVPSDKEVSRATGLADMGDVTIEIRAKVLANHGDRGWKFLYIDTLGGLSLYLSPGKVETGPGTKPVGILSYPMNTTDAFHTYRLVRKAGEIYAHLYVDNDPVPAIVDQRLSAETEARGYEANPYIVWGSTTYYPAPFQWPVRTVESHVEFEYIRWNGYALAPPLP